MGTYVIDKMKEKCKASSIEVLTEHEALALLVDDEDNFTGVSVKTRDGTKTVKGENCLVATGGFARNRALMEQLEPTLYQGEQVHTFTVANNTGDAVTIAEAIGEEMDFEHVNIPMSGPLHHPYSFPSCALREVQGPSWCLWRASVFKTRAWR